MNNTSNESSLCLPESILNRLGALENMDYVLWLLNAVSTFFCALCVQKNKLIPAIRDWLSILVVLFTAYPLFLAVGSGLLVSFAFPFTQFAAFIISCAPLSPLAIGWALLWNGSVELALVIVLLSNIVGFATLCLALEVLGPLLFRVNPSVPPSYATIFVEILLYTVCISVAVAIRVAKPQFRHKRILRIAAIISFCLATATNGLTHILLLHFLGLTQSVFAVWSFLMFVVCTSFTVPVLAAAHRPQSYIKTAVLVNLLRILWVDYSKNPCIHGDATGRIRFVQTNLFVTGSVIHFCMVIIHTVSKYLTHHPRKTENAIVELADISTAIAHLGTSTKEPKRRYNLRRLTTTYLQSLERPEVFTVGQMIRYHEKTSNGRISDRTNNKIKLSEVDSEIASRAPPSIKVNDELWHGSLTDVSNFSGHTDGYAGINGQVPGATAVTQLTVRKVSAFDCCNC